MKLRINSYITAQARISQNNAEHQVARCVKQQSSNTFEIIGKVTISDRITVAFSPTMTIEQAMLWHVREQKYTIILVDVAFLITFITELRTSWVWKIDKNNKPCRAEN